MSRKSKSQPLEGEVSHGIVLVIRTFAAIAIALASYLAWVSFGGSNVVGCGPESGCMDVLNSRWAYWFGIPVSALGLVVYVTLFAGTFCLGHKTAPAQQRKAWGALIPAAVMAAGAALWFAGVQWFDIGKVCPFCMAAHGAALVAAGLTLLNAPYRRLPDKPWQQEKQIYVRPALAKKLVFGGVLGLAGLLLGQFVHQKKTFLEESVVGGANIETNAHTARILQLHGGAIQINLDEVPLLGRRDAPHVMLSMHDYTCHGCRTMHEPLMTMWRQFSNDLALISLPMPLDSNCNPMVKRTPTAHTNACQYALIGLAVWRAKPEALTTFDDWIFTPHSPPPLPETLDYARNLVGTQAFDQAMQDPWVQQQLEQDVTLYTLNSQTYTNGSMPQFLIGSNMTFGSLTYPQLLQKVTNQYPLLPTQR